MAQGTLKTKITSNALQKKWTVPNVDHGGVSPLFLFDSFDAFTIMLRLKIKPTDHGLMFFIQTKGTYGSLPEMLTMTLTINNSSTNFEFERDTEWMQVYDCNKFYGTVTIYIEVHLPYTYISMLSAPENNFSNLLTIPGADITIESGVGKSKNIHKSVLLAKSDVLRTMWKNDTLERKSNHLKIPELDADSLEMFINYLYRGSIKDFSFQHCLKLLSIADKYNMSDLLAKCRNYVRKNLTKYNVIDTYLIAILHNLEYLRTESMGYIHMNIADIILTEAWRKTNNASFFKRIYEKLNITEQAIIGQDEKCDASTRHCLIIDFPVDIQTNKEVVHFMTVFPERDSGYFCLKFSEENNVLSTYQYQPADICCFTGVTFKNIKINNSAHEQIALDDMKVNQWYSLASCQVSCCGHFPISLEISYDLKFIPKKSAFAELLTDLHSADMTLESSDGTFRHVHKSVLIARNMHKMVDECDSKDELKLPNISTIALDAFIRFVYTGDEVALDTDSCAELLPISHIYNFKELKYQCEIKLKTTIDVANAMRLLSMAVSTKSIFLQQWILDYVLQNQSDIIETEDWHECNDSDVLRKIIEHYVNIQESLVTYRSISAT